MEGSDFIKYRDVERVGRPDNSTIFEHQDDDIVVEEKVDGGCGAIFVQDNKLHICSRNRDMTLLKDEKAFEFQQKWLHNHFKDNVHLLDERFIYYGELMQKHTINYGKDIPPFIGLDILPKEGAFGKPPLFLGRTAKEKEFKRIGIPVVPLIWRGTVKEFKKLNIDDLLLSESGVSKLCPKV